MLRGVRTAPFRLSRRVRRWLMLRTVALVLSVLAILLSGPAALRAQQAAPEVSPPDAETLSAVDEAARLPEIAEIDLDAWEDLAQRAENAIYRDAASNAALEALRREVAAFRSDFLEAQSLNAARIETLRSQIAALAFGGSSDDVPPAVATRRAALEIQLVELAAPVLAAEEAYTRADGIIAEIDRIIRNRQTERLREIGPSPLNPALWGPALRELTAALAGLERETRAALTSAVRREERIDNAPRTLLFLLIAGLLLLRGRAWARDAGTWIVNRVRRGGAVGGFLVSLGEIGLPLAGIFALEAALQGLGIVGPRGQLLLTRVPDWAAVVLATLWLADRLFGAHDGVQLLPMQAKPRREARVYSVLLAVFVVLQDGLDELGDLALISPGTDAVLFFPVMVLAALTLFRVGTLMRRRVVFETGPEGRPPPTRARFVSLLGQAAIVIAATSPVLAMIGYGALARALVFPAIVTLFIAGLVLVLQRFTADLFRFAMGQGDDEEDGLFPVLIGVALMLLSLPLVALVWGARVADLTELWTRFSAGFTIGGTRFQPSDFLVFLFVFVLLYSATRILQATLRNTVLPKTRLDTGGRNAVVSGVGYVGIILAAIISVSATGINMSALTFIFTALSVGIGFGLQNIVQNFVSGIILLIERPIAEGDWIEVGGNMGYVRDISVRSTRIETFDRTDLIIPNGDLISGTVTNYTRGNSIGRVIVPVGVAYGTDTRLVEGILLSIAREHDMVLMNPPPVVLFQGFGADSLDFEIRAILRDVNYVMSVKSEMNHMINDRFAAAGIEIPFAQRDVWLRNPEVLTGTPAVPEPDDPQRSNPPAPPASARLGDDELGGEIGEAGDAGEGGAAGEGDGR